jgi:hypothetical protein
MKATPRKKRYGKITSGISVQVSAETLMLMESLKIYFDCDESALFELMIRKLHDETFYSGLSPLVKSIITKADEAHDESAETEKIQK